MTADSLPQLDSLLVEVLRRPPHERLAFMDQVCCSDPGLRRELEDLLRLHEQAGDFLEAPAVVLPDTIRNAPIGEALESVIGPYKLLERLGEGGFGTVYLAEQDKPVRRRVALKIIKLGMDTRQVIARFEAERQALAMMDHPHIARVLDAGATQGGRPFFVMELVKGVPITQFCDEHRTPLRERLTLFTDVCHAVQHAHQKGIIHRDLKPSNVLVSRHDDKPVVKVIDFGIVKATGRRLTEQTIHTEMRQLIGTPAYMSPEQAGMSDLDVDTRSDIYSLGVLLYQLLTGTTPFDEKSLLESGYDEMRRIIREVEPPKPSTRLSSLAERRPLRSEPRAPASGSSAHAAEPIARAPGSDHGCGSDSSAVSLANVASKRHSEPMMLVRTLRGDLDWIVMKCLEKDRTRRYETASTLAADVQRHLIGEPVVAAPPSSLYRLSKTLRRHRTAVAVAAGFVLLTSAGLVSTGIFWRAESDQRARAEAINTFLTEMLTAPAPAKAKGAKLTVREALDTAAKGLDARPLKDQPLVEAEIRFTIGSTYFALGLYPQAESQLRAVDALQSRELGDEHPDTLRTRTKLAQALNRQSHFAGAAKLAEATMEAQHRVLGAEHPDTLQSMMVAGAALSFTGRYADGVALLQAAVDGRRRVLGENHPDTADAMNRLGMVYKNNRHPEKAEPLLREALRIHTEVLGEDHPDTLFSMDVLGDSLYSQFRPEAAEVIYRRALELNLGALGPEHTGTLGARGKVAASLDEQGRHAEAEALYHENLAALLRNMGPTDLPLIYGKRDLADCLVRQGKYPEAETLLREALDVALEKYGPEHGDTSIRLMCALASVLAKQRKDAEAEQVSRQVLELQHRQLPRPDLFELGQSSYALIEVLKRRAASDEALRVEQELLQSLLAAAHKPDANTGTLHRAAKALLYPANAQLRDAPRALKLELQVNEQSGYQNAHFLRTLAHAYVRTGDPERATQIWEQAIALLLSDQRRATWLNQAAWDLLTVIPETLRGPAGALKFALRANELSDYKNPLYLETLAQAHLLASDPGRATQVWEQAIALSTDNESSAVKLNGAAWKLLTVTPETLRDPAGALKLALRANEVSEYKNPAQLDTLALAYQRTGNTAKAIELQNKAISLLAADAPDRAEYEDRLREFQAASEPAVDRR